MSDALNQMLAAVAPTANAPKLTVRPPVAELLDYMHAQGEPLDIASAWHLLPREERNLEQATGLIPEGGWGNLVSVLAGTEAVKAYHYGFAATQTAQQWEQLTAVQVQTALVEAFTLRLAPPSPAAALGVALQVHPLWLLRVARVLGTSGLGSDTDDSGSKALQATQTGVFTTIATFFRALSHLPEGASVPISAVCAVLAACVQQGRRVGIALQQQDPNPLTGVEPFSVGPGFVNAGEMAARDLISELLVPAGVAALVSGDRVVFQGSVLANVRFASITKGEIELSFNQLFATQSGALQTH